MFRRRRPAPRRGGSLLGLLALLLLIALILARRMTVHAPKVAVPTNVAPPAQSGEHLTPADRHDLNELIRNKTGH